MRHIHLDPLGGIAGDMFVAAMLDAFPHHCAATIAAAQSLAGVPCTLSAHDGGVLRGARFSVDAPDRHHQDHHHGHTHWAALRDRISRSDLLPEIRTHAIGIFAILAEAEAHVHGVAPDDVVFHEVGAVDSIADIVAAAAIIAAIGPTTWSTGPLPLGGGRVRTAHGVMPVPAPATAWLMAGFATLDDGIGGERVTPTGAAILRYLAPGKRPRLAMLGCSGTGFGTRVLPDLSNCLRALVLESDVPTETTGHRDLAVISFEVDDQCGEDLAAGVERLRAMAGVHDVIQIAAFGKKSRLAVHVQVLTRPDMLEQVIDACFRETTTIGLRTHLVQGRALARRFADVTVDGIALRVKRVDRPGGATGKVEADDLRGIAGQAARTTLRRAAETVPE